MNAYELERAAFDSACDNAEESIKYIQGYADGAFDQYISTETAQKILDCRAACSAANDLNGEWQNNHHHFIRVPLEEIEI